MPEWHLRCDDPDCWYRCQRVGCRRADSHIFAAFNRDVGHYFHRDDCRIEFTPAEQVVAELHPGLNQEELAAAKRVLQAALEELRQLQQQTGRRRPHVA